MDLASGHRSRTILHVYCDTRQREEPMETRDGQLVHLCSYVVKWRGECNETCLSRLLFSTGPGELS